MAKYGKFVALIAIAALAVGALALAGCTTPAAPTTPPTTTQTTTPPADLKLVTPGALTVGSDTSFPPFESMNGNVAEGFDVDLMGALAKEMGITTVVFKTEIFDTLIPTL
jgi:ABC-type amino acid transport substrate-binding protein